VVASTAGYHYREMVAAGTRSTIHHRANIPLSNNQGALRTVITKIPSPRPPSAGNHLPRELVASHADPPLRHLVLMDLLAEDKCNRRRLIRKPRLMAIRRLPAALQAIVILLAIDGQEIHTEEKMEIHTGGSEIHTADIIEATNNKPAVDIC
jgi:hypothetical protein